MLIMPKPRSEISVLNFKAKAEFCQGIVIVLQSTRLARLATKRAQVGQVGGKSDYLIV